MMFFSILDNNLNVQNLFSILDNIPPNLHSIDVSKNKIDLNDFQVILSTIEYFHKNEKHQISHDIQLTIGKEQSIHLRPNGASTDIEFEGINYISPTLLSNFSDIKTLEICGEKTSFDYIPKDVSGLYEYLPKCTNVEVLNLASN